MGEKEVCLYKTILALSFCFFSLLTGAQITHPAEVAALNAVRRQLTDPLKFLDNWKKGDPCTWNWTGIICTDLDPVDGYLHIQELRLLKMNLSGTLAPELGDLKNVTILNFMWNQISGSIPKDVGNMTSLVFLLLSGNQITGPMPDELGFLQNLKKFQLDLNQISGPIPKTFAKLLKVEHFHMNDNQFSGQLPPEISVLPKLKHILLDNNRFTGYLPPELANMSSLTILQLDNNDFQGTGIPSSYANMPKLVKLSLVNCSLEGTIPDFSGIVTLTYLDLSRNQFTGNIPSNSLSSNITTIDLSNNEINGTIPSSFSGLPLLQKLSLENNSLSGSVPTTIWNNITFTPVTKLILDFQYNLLSDVSGSLDPPANVTVICIEFEKFDINIFRLQGNPVCTSANRRNISQFCGSKTEDFGDEETSNDSTNTTTCPPHSCPTGDGYEFAPAYPDPCYCALPFGVEIRLRSPSISDFTPYRTKFETYLTSNLKLDLFQLGIVSIMWERGPRLRMFLKFFPPLSNTTKKFNLSEVERITGMFATFSINGSDVFGPYDLLNFTLSDVYSTVHIPHANAKTSKGLSGGGVAGIVLGVVFSIAILLCIKCCFFRKRSRPQQNVPTIKEAPKAGIKIEGVKEFAFEELELTTSSFSSEAQIGQGGYGKVYKGVLADGTVVAIKRATQSSLQSDREFYTEIELLSRLHHRNLVSLIGYCDKENEQMLVYEFMPLGSLHDLLSARYSGKLNFETRLHIALGAARGILYLHTEADPPIIHRDIKANNILLDSKFNAKVADFGISRLAPVPNAEGITTAYISTGVKGTPGYVDPQYLLTHTLNEKSDVYSLGIVFLELLTGMRPISHGRNIVQEVNAACQSGMMFSIIDRNMGGYPSECVKKFMGLSIRCTHDERKDRPSMLEVVRQLENIASMLPESEKKTYQLDVSNTGISGSVPSSVHPTTSYATYDGDGSDLVSGVIPTIKPR